ncbi:hypothetical protein [Marinilabilia salmonicolor]|uniref:Uncharacterized protein n=1 Tax=Marinilabilia salmonicolor TaxID=989 RepID=A0A368UKR9_9BACT|nr:hypothetical protein [Marinilabilia salmonicolor]RCW24980.1 hypothetical protein DFO77_1443 [Marinilabilia salmonicolor]
MKDKNLKNKTSKKLESKLKGIRILTIALIVVLALLLILSIYGFMTVKNNPTFIALIAVAISCSAILPSQFSNMRKIKTELNRRNGNE